MGVDGLYMDLLECIQRWPKYCHESEMRTASMNWKMGTMIWWMAAARQCSRGENTGMEEQTVGGCNVSGWETARYVDSFPEFCVARTASSFFSARE